MSTMFIPKTKDRGPYKKSHLEATMKAEQNIKLKTLNIIVNRNF